MKCCKCNKSLQDETAVADNEKTYCFKCYVKTVDSATKALKKPVKNKMISGEAVNVKHG